MEDNPQDNTKHGRLINIDLRGMSQIANNLINKVSEAVGTVYEPVHEKRIARAKAAARVTKAKTDVEIANLERRARSRWIQEEARNQENLESVVKGAIPHLRDDAKPEKLDDDWLVRFSDYAKKISDKELQSLWSKILAGQVNGASSYRKSLLHTVSLLEKEDAELFASLCRCCIDLGGIRRPAVLGCNDAIYNQIGLTFDSLVHLDTIGLITFDSSHDFVETDCPAEFFVKYFGKTFKVALPQGSDGTIPIGCVLMSAVGTQLVPLSNAQALEGFMDYVAARWRRRGFIVGQLDIENEPARPGQHPGN